jgi:type IV fimbrial biogenesis protein FimT
MAITSGTSVRLSVLPMTSGGSCYVIYTGAANGCVCQGQGQARCDAGTTLLRLEEQSGSAGVTLVPLQRSLIFDANKGTVTPTATVQVVAADGRAIHQIVNIMGRVRACSPSASVGGLPVCR